ncbi:MAG: integrase core domain-containing protein [Actinobacteria bacterium]|nr:integrase core domain-containing protein [Actinomycetota bacterium]
MNVSPPAGPGPCNDPFSEAQLKTLKYAPAFPANFGSLADARAFCETFFSYYKREHRHSGIALHTPASVYFGTAGQVRQQRQATLYAAYNAHPERFRHRRPEPPKLPAAAWIQPAQQGGPHPEQLDADCLKPLDTFRHAEHHVHHPVTPGSGRGVQEATAETTER